MKDKIKERLKEHDLIETDLTSEELTELKEEIEAEERGETVLDGVLFYINVFERIAKRENKQ